MIRKEGSLYYVYSEGGKRLSRGYLTEGEAQHRLGEIEYFKAQEDQILVELGAAETFEDAEYQGRDVTLNKPFRTPDGPKKFSVYVRGDNGVIKVNFGDPNAEIKRDDPKARAAFRSRHKCSTRTDRTTPSYWSCRMWGRSTVTSLTDANFVAVAVLDADSKRIQSVRDGVQDYLGVELGIQPYEELFTVYRSPETIAAITNPMVGLPIVQGHVSNTEPVPEGAAIGSVLDSEVTEYINDSTDSSLILQNSISVSDELIRCATKGQKYFSLGYMGNLREHEVYDFEQYDIVPKHLGLVDSPRGGETLTFMDGKPRMYKLFTDADGTLNMERTVEIAQALPEAMRKMPMEKLMEVLPMMQEIVEMANMSGGEMPAGENNDADEDMDMDDQKMMDGDTSVEEDLNDQEMPMKKEDDMEDQKNYTDAKTVQKMIQNEVRRTAQITEKARKILPDTYNFADASPDQIMRDALALYYPEDNFADNEVSTAFKLLKVNNNYQNFGDSSSTKDYTNVWEGHA